MHLVLTWLLVFLAICMFGKDGVDSSVRTVTIRAMLFGGTLTCSVDKATRTLSVISKSHCLSLSTSGDWYPGFNYKTSTDPPTCELFSCLPINFVATKNCTYFQLSQAEFVAMEGNVTGCLPVHQKTDQLATFDRTWSEFKVGFGDLHINYYWIGNDRLHELTKDGGYKLRVDLKSISGLWYWAGYNTFIVGNEAAEYQLKLDGYVGTAGNSWGQPLGAYTVLDGMNFTTKDRDNDVNAVANCAKYAYIVGGFWYRCCGGGTITGGTGGSIGFLWYTIPDAYGQPNNLAFARMTLIKVV